MSQTPNMVVHKIKMGFIFFVTSVIFWVPVHQAHRPSLTISQLSVKNLDFAMNLYRKISSLHDENIFFSPLSVSASFAALLMASDGVTYKEILKGLNLHRLEQADQPELIPKLFKLLNENITQNGSLHLDQGMALFMHQQFQAEKVFVDQLKMFFDASIKSVDFNDTKGTIDLINEYIKSKTQGKITKAVSALDAMVRLMLINTIFFQGGLNCSYEV